MPIPRHPALLRARWRYHQSLSALQRSAGEAILRTSERGAPYGDFRALVVIDIRRQWLKRLPAHVPILKEVQLIPFTVGTLTLFLSLDREIFTITQPRYKGRIVQNLPDVYQWTYVRYDIRTDPKGIFTQIVQGLNEIAR